MKLKTVHLTIAAIFATLLTVLTGCGQKKPLYLPPEQNTQVADEQKQAQAKTSSETESQEQNK